MLQEIAKVKMQKHNLETLQALCQYLRLYLDQLRVEILLPQNPLDILFDIWFHHLLFKFDHV